MHENSLKAVAEDLYHSAYLREMTGLIDGSDECNTIETADTLLAEKEEKRRQELEEATAKYKGRLSLILFPKCASKVATSPSKVTGTSSQVGDPPSVTSNGRGACCSYERARGCTHQLAEGGKRFGRQADGDAGFTRTVEEEAGELERA